MGKRNSSAILVREFFLFLKSFEIGAKKTVLVSHWVDDALTMIDATKLAETDLGDAIYANVLMPDQPGHI